MREDGVLAAILPEADALERLAALVRLEPAADPVRRLGALLAIDAAGAERVARRLKLTTAERDRLAAMAAAPSPVALDADARAQRRALYHLGAPLYRDLVLLRAAERGADARASELLALAEAWRKPRFPLRGRDVTARGVAPGPEVGRLLAAVEAWWEAGDFGAERQSCLAELERHMARG